MTIDRHLKHLAQKDPENRQKALLDVLIQEGLEFSLQEQEPSIQNPRGIRNYLLTPWSPEPSLLFCAHYLTTMLYPEHLELMTMLQQSVS